MQTERERKGSFTLPFYLLVTLVNDFWWGGEGTELGKKEGFGLFFFKPNTCTFKGFQSELY